MQTVRSPIAKLYGARLPGKYKGQDGELTWHEYVGNTIKRARCDMKYWGVAGTVEGAQEAKAARRLATTGNRRVGDGKFVAAAAPEHQSLSPDASRSVANSATVSGLSNLEIAQAQHAQRLHDQIASSGSRFTPLQVVGDDDDDDDDDDNDDEDLVPLNKRGKQHVVDDEPPEPPADDSDDDDDSPKSQFERRAAEQLGKCSRGASSSSDPVDGAASRSSSPVKRSPKSSPKLSPKRERSPKKERSPPRELRLGPDGTFVIGSKVLATLHVPEAKMPASTPVSSTAPTGSKKARAAATEAARAEAKEKKAAEAAEAKEKKAKEAAEKKEKKEQEQKEAKAKREAEKSEADAKKQAEKEGKKAKVAAEEKKAAEKLLKIQEEIKEQEALMRQMHKEQEKMQAASAGKKRTSEDAENENKNPSAKQIKVSLSNSLGTDSRTIAMSVASFDLAHDPRATQCDVCKTFVDCDDIEACQGNWQCISREACYTRATDLAPRSRKRKHTPLGGMGK